MKRAEWLLRPSLASSSDGVPCRPTSVDNGHVKSLAWDSTSARLGPLTSSPRQILWKRVDSVEDELLEELYHLQDVVLAAGCWWLAFLPQWSGVSIIRPTREDVFIWTDAAGKKGIGGYLLEAIDNRWRLCARNMPSAHESLVTSARST
jgi:hypothetical protein